MGEQGARARVDEREGRVFRFGSVAYPARLVGRVDAHCPLGRTRTGRVSRRRRLGGGGGEQVLVIVREERFVGGGSERRLLLPSRHCLLRRHPRLSSEPVSGKRSTSVRVGLFSVLSLASRGLSSLGRAREPQQVRGSDGPTRCTELSGNLESDRRRSRHRSWNLDRTRPQHTAASTAPAHGRIGSNTKADPFPHRLAHLRRERKHHHHGSTRPPTRLRGRKPLSDHPHKPANEHTPLLRQRSQDFPSRAEALNGPRVIVAVTEPQEGGGTSSSARRPSNRHARSKSRSKSRSRNGSTKLRRRPPLLDKGFLRNKLWLLGFGLMNGGELCNFLAYAFAPPSVVAPLGMVTLIANVFLAPLVVREVRRAFRITPPHPLPLPINTCSSSLQADSSISHSDDAHAQPFRKKDLIGVAIAVLGGATVVYASHSNDTKVRIPSPRNEDAFFPCLAPRTDNNRNGRKSKRPAVDASPIPQSHLAPPLHRLLRHQSRRHHCPRVAQSDKVRRPVRLDRFGLVRTCRSVRPSSHHPCLWLLFSWDLFGLARGAD